MDNPALLNLILVNPALLNPALLNQLLDPALLNILFNPVNPIDPQGPALLNILLDPALLNEDLTNQVVEAILTNNTSALLSLLAENPALLAASTTSFSWAAEGGWWSTPGSIRTGRWIPKEASVGGIPFLLELLVLDRNNQRY